MSAYRDRQRKAIRRERYLVRCLAAGVALLAFTLAAQTIVFVLGAANTALDSVVFVSIIILTALLASVTAWILLDE